MWAVALAKSISLGLYRRSVAAKSSIEAFVGNQRAFGTTDFTLVFQIPGE